MRLDFQQKIRLIDHFSIRSNWQNTFDPDFYADDARKGSTRTVASGVSCSMNSGGNKIAITHTTGAALGFELQENRVFITDESGNQFTVSDSKIHCAGLDAAVTFPIGAPGDFVDVPGTKLAVSFDAEGNKSIILNDQRLTLPKPAEKPSHLLHRGGDRHHVATITDEMAEAWGIASADLVDIAKMVVAHDLGLETGLPAHNLPNGVSYTLETHVPGTDVPHLRPFERVAFTETPWRDTTEFEGHEIALARAFAVQRDKGKLHLNAAYDQREAILSQGDILRTVLAGETAPVRTLTGRSEALHVLQSLIRGAVTRDQRGREWNYVVVQTKDALDIAAKLRKAMRDEFGLTARDCSVLTFDKGMCVLAMASKVLDAAARHSRTGATIRQAVEDARLSLS